MGILGRAPGAAGLSPSDCGTAADSARGAATAPAMTLPVVARKPLRVEERGSNLSAMKFLDVELRSAEHYTHDGDYSERKGNGGKSCKNQNRPVAGGLASWVETPRLRPEAISMRTLGLVFLQ